MPEGLEQQNSDLSNKSKRSGIILTIVRHGESVDNIGHIWAGVKDSHLSNYGYNQTKSLSEFFKNSSTQFTKMYCSDLQRARITAQSIEFNQRPSKGTPQDDKEDFLEVLPILREQNFGIAEGKPWSSGEFKFDYKFFTQREVGFFKDGESLDEVFNRAKKFIYEVLISKWLLKGSKSDDENGEAGLDPNSSAPDAHLCIVSHGVFLSEFVNALRAIVDHEDGDQRNPKISSELNNTGWTRIQLESYLHENNDINPSSSPSPSISMKVLNINQTDHLVGLKRQPGGFGNLKFDPNQSVLDPFLSRK